MTCPSPMMSLKEENTNEQFEQNQSPPVTTTPNTTTDNENNNAQGIEKLAQLVFQQIAQTKSGPQNQGMYSHY